MALQSLPLVNHQFSPIHSPAISFPSKEEQITQAQLIRVVSLRNMISALRSDLEAVESGIKVALENGASVQPGVHVASLKETLRRNVAWREIAERLADRLYSGKGHAYTENVIGNTHPTPSVSLVVS